MVDGSLLFDTGIDSSGFQSGINGLTIAAGNAIGNLAADMVAKVSEIVAQLPVQIYSVGSGFESAFAGVKKTVNETFDISYDDINTEIRDMAKNTMPVAANSIASVAEEAGQLGIATENITDFSSVMVNLAEATNLTTDEAAFQLAKFVNITQMSANKYSNLGATIVDLGNNFATTEADIVNMSTRLASTGKIAGMSEADILALSAAMSSVGIEAEVGGSSMSTFIKKMQTAVETGNEDLQKFADVAGMTIDEFSKLWGENSAAAITAFIGNLNNIEQNGQSAIQILNDMELTDIGLSNTLLSLANSGDLMTNAIEKSNSAWQENSALTDEVAKRYDTTESVLNFLKNNVTDLGITIYEKFRDPLRDAFSSATESVNELNESVSDGELSASFDRISESFSEFITTSANLAANDIIPSIISGMDTIVTYNDEIIASIGGIAAAVAVINIVPVITSTINGVQQASLALAAMTGISGTAAVSQAALAGSLTRTQFAVGILEGKIKLATAATVIFNSATVAAIASTAALAALAAVTIGAALAFKQYVDEMETAAAIDPWDEQARKSVEAARKQKEAYENLIASREEGNSADEAEISNIQRLWSELQNYVDESGKVISNNERASEIIGLLNNNYDMNIDYIDGQIQGYGELAGSMDDYIKKLRLEAKIRNGQDSYDEAIAEQEKCNKRRLELGAELQKKLVAFQSTNDLEQKSIFGIQAGNIREEITILDETAGLYQDTIDEYEGLFSQATSSDVASVAEMQAKETARRVREATQQAAEEAAETAKENTEKLTAAWAQAEHNYAIGIIASESALYAEKQRIWEEYGNESNQEHWQYYEDLIGLQQEYSEKSQQEYRRQLNSEWSAIDNLSSLGLISTETALERKLAFIEKYCPKYSDEWYDYYKDVYDLQSAHQEEQIESLKSSLNEQVDTVENGLNDLVSSYKSAYSEIQSNIDGYKNKLLSVGEAFSVIENEDGSKTLKVNDLREQMAEMKKYHAYIKQLKESGASAGLISELTSMDFKDGSAFASKLVNLSDADFAEINNYYKERDELAASLSQELYQPEIDKLNTNLTNDIMAKFNELPEAIRATAVASAQAFTEGLQGSDISKQVEDFCSSFMSSTDTAINEFFDGDNFSVDFESLFEQDSYSMGKQFGDDFVSGFNESMAELQAAIRSEQAGVTAEYTVSGKTQSDNSNSKSNGGTERIVLENHITARLDVDGEKMAEKVIEKAEVINRRKGK